MNIPDPPFEYRVTKQNKTLIHRGAKLVMTLSPPKTLNLQSKIVGKTAFEIQMILAKITGQYKFGNEKDNKSDD